MSMVAGPCQRALAAVALVFSSVMMSAPSEARALPLAAAAAVVRSVKFSKNLVTERVDGTTYRARVRVTASAAGVLKKDVDTAWVTMKQGETKHYESKKVGPFRLVGDFKWSGNQIVAAMALEVGVGPLKAKKRFQLSAPVK